MLPWLIADGLPLPSPPFRLNSSGFPFSITASFLSSVHSFGAFLAFSLLYGLIYAPTLALTNSLTFHHVPDRDRDFGKVLARMAAKLDDIESAIEEIAP